MSESAVQATIQTLRSEPTLLRVPEDAIVCTAWAKSPEIQDFLAGIKYRHHHKALLRLLSAARRCMEDERATILAECEETMGSAVWDEMSNDEQHAYLLKVVAAANGDPTGGPTALLSARTEERTLFVVFGTKRCFKTMCNINARLEKRGLFRIERGKPGYATKDNSNRYHLLPEDYYTSPHRAGRACVKGPSRAWLEKMEPLFRQLREALGEAIAFFRRLKALPEYRFRHIPWEECYYLPAEQPEATPEFLALLNGDDLSSALTGLEMAA